MAQPTFAVALGERMPDAGAMSPVATAPLPFWLLFLACSCRSYAVFVAVLNANRRRMPLRPLRRRQILRAWAMRRVVIQKAGALRICAAWLRGAGPQCSALAEEFEQAALSAEGGTGSASANGNIRCPGCRT